MELQDLPLELFQRIIDHTVQVCGAPESLRFRQVSPLFASQILDSIILRQPLDMIFAYQEEGFGGPKGKQLATTYGGAILDARLSTMTNDLSQFIQGVLNDFFELRPPSSDVVRRKQVREFCDAITAQGDWARTFACLNIDNAEERQYMHGYLSHETCSRNPVAAAAAAVGELDLLRSLLSGLDNAYDDARYNISIVPDPFHAAAATGKLDVIKWYLDLVQDTWKGVHPPPMMQHARIKRRIIRALSVAIRKFQTDATFFIADFQFPWDPDSWRGHRMTDAVLEAIRYNRGDILVHLLSRRLASDSARRNLTAPQSNRLVLTDHEIEFLFREGSRRTLKHLLDNGALHPDGLENSWTIWTQSPESFHTSYPPTLFLNHALCGKRQDLVRMLLGKGADINVRAGGTQWGLKSPLQEAVDAATTPENIHDVQFLIEQGADPITVQEGPILALEYCCIAARYLQTASARPDAEKWHELWQTERDGRLKPLWDELNPQSPPSPSYDPCSPPLTPILPHS